ncbi:RrF2 family transcriptional regulator [Fuscibacter oryzae]|uniref:Rrf2 family transcriptional regulator n=1 Tax=Fuscibacter oryzae TaxID=2803939 RepID=A0A8J7MR64_9RHOB|nr:Rrf2 family transcriptional regulator [Fuscibacter oryzae]MBL4928977.1 Rrf2 family transcriptional regulator [Fuscibacter oryzae]
MRLTSFTDYAIRLLIYAAAHPQGRVTISEAADYFAISHGHLKKVVMTLAHGGFIASMKGRNGGLALAVPADQINMADVVLTTEPDFGLFECFLTGNACRISRPCQLPNFANEALEAFVAVLRKYTLADVLVRPEYFTKPVAASQPLRGPRLKGVRLAGPQAGL